MFANSVRWSAVRCAAVMLVALVVIGCPQQPQQQPPPQPKTVTFPCGDHIIDVMTSGLDPKNKAVYVCEGDTVTWNPASDVKTMEVEFENDSPFEGGKKKFNKDDRKSPKTAPQPYLKVYPYKLTVNGQQVDPQIIGGGGNH